MLDVVVLVSGSGTLLQALIDDVASGGAPYRLVGVGSDRTDIAGLARARAARLETFVVDVAAHPDRAAWDAALCQAISDLGPQVVVSAGFMKIIGPVTLDRHRILNTHPALLPSFPGAHAVRDALTHGVVVTGTTCHWVDEGVDTGPIIDQREVRVNPDDDEASLHERIKVQERLMLVDVLHRIATGDLPVPS